MSADDVAAALLERFGDGWLDVIEAYRSLAESRGVSLQRVLQAASEDDLRSIITLEATSAG